MMASNPLQFAGGKRNFATIAPGNANPMDSSKSNTGNNSAGDELRQSLAVSLRGLLVQHSLSNNTEGGDDALSGDVQGGDQANDIYRQYLGSPGQNNGNRVASNNSHPTAATRQLTEWTEKALGAVGIATPGAFSDGNNGNSLKFWNFRGGESEEDLCDARYMVWLVKEILLASADSTLEGEGEGIHTPWPMDPNQLPEGSDGEASAYYAKFLDQWHGTIENLINGSDQNLESKVMWKLLLENNRLTPDSLRQYFREGHRGTGDGVHEGEGEPMFQWPSFLRNAILRRSSKHSDEGDESSDTIITAGSMNKRRKLNNNTSGEWKGGFNNSRGIRAALQKDDSYTAWWPLFGYSVTSAFLSISPATESEMDEDSTSAFARQKVDYVVSNITSSLPLVMGIPFFNQKKKNALLAGIAACVLDALAESVVTGALRLSEEEGAEGDDSIGQAQPGALCSVLGADVVQVVDLLLKQGILPALAKAVHSSLPNLVAESAEILMSYSEILHRLKHQNNDLDDISNHLMAEDGEKIVRFIREGNPLLSSELASRKFSIINNPEEGVGETPLHPIDVDVRARLMAGNVGEVARICLSLEECSGVSSSTKEQCWVYLLDKMQQEGLLLEDGSRTNNSSNSCAENGQNCHNHAVTLSQLKVGQIGRKVVLEYLRDIVIVAKQELYRESHVLSSSNSEVGESSKQELLCVKDAVRRAVLKFLVPKRFSEQEALLTANNISEACVAPKLEDTRWDENSGSARGTAAEVANRILASPPLYQIWEERCLQQENNSVEIEKVHDDSTEPNVSFIGEESNEESSAVDMSIDQVNTLVSSKTPRDQSFEEIENEQAPSPSQDVPVAEDESVVVEVVEEVTEPEEPAESPVDSALLDENGDSDYVNVDASVLESKEDIQYDADHYETDGDQYEDDHRAGECDEADDDQFEDEEQAGEFEDDSQEESVESSHGQDEDDLEDYEDGDGEDEMQRHHHSLGNYSASDDYEDEDNEEAERHVAFHGVYEEEEESDEVVEILESSDEDGEGLDEMDDELEKHEEARKDDQDRTEALNAAVDMYISTTSKNESTECVGEEDDGYVQQIIAEKRCDGDITGVDKNKDNHDTTHDILEGKVPGGVGTGGEGHDINLEEVKALTSEELAVMDEKEGELTVQPEEENFGPIKSTSAENNDGHETAKCDDHSMDQDDTEMEQNNESLHSEAKPESHESVGEKIGEITTPDTIDQGKANLFECEASNAEDKLPPTAEGNLLDDNIASLDTTETVVDNFGSSPGHLKNRDDDGKESGPEGIDEMKETHGERNNAAIEHDATPYSSDGGNLARDMTDTDDMNMADDEHESIDTEEDKRSLAEGSQQGETFDEDEVEPPSSFGTSYVADAANEGEHMDEPSVLVAAAMSSQRQGSHFLQSSTPSRPFEFPDDIGSDEESSPEDKASEDDGYVPDAEATEEEHPDRRKEERKRAIDEDGYVPDADATEEDKPKAPKKEERAGTGIEDGYMPDGGHTTGGEEASEIEQGDDSNKRITRDVRFETVLETKIVDSAVIAETPSVEALPVEPATSQSIDEGYLPSDGLTEEEKVERSNLAKNRPVKSTSTQSVDEGYIPDEGLTEEERGGREKRRRRETDSGYLPDGGHTTPGDATEEDQGDEVERRVAQKIRRPTNEPSSQAENVSTSRLVETRLEDAIDEGYLPSAVEGTEEERSEEEDTTVHANSNNRTLSLNRNSETLPLVQGHDAIASVLVSAALSSQQKGAAAVSLPVGDVVVGDASLSASSFDERSGIPPFDDTSAAVAPPDANLSEYDGSQDGDTSINAENGQEKPKFDLTSMSTPEKDAIDGIEPLGRSTEHVENKDDNEDRNQDDKSAVDELANEECAGSTHVDVAGEVPPVADVPEKSKGNENPNNTEANVNSLALLAEQSIIASKSRAAQSIKTGLLGKETEIADDEKKPVNVPGDPSTEKNGSKNTIGQESEPDRIAPESDAITREAAKFVGNANASDEEQDDKSSTAKSESSGLRRSSRRKSNSSPSPTSDVPTSIVTRGKGKKIHALPAVPEDGAIVLAAVAGNEDNDEEEIKGEIKSHADDDSSIASSIGSKDDDSVSTATRTRRKRRSNILEKENAVHNNIEEITPQKAKKSKTEGSEKPSASSAGIRTGRRSKVAEENADTKTSLDNAEEVASKLDKVGSRDGSVSVASARGKRKKATKESAREMNAFDEEGSPENFNLEENMEMSETVSIPSKYGRRGKLSKKDDDGPGKSPSFVDAEIITEGLSENVPSSPTAVRKGRSRKSNAGGNEAEEKNNDDGSVSVISTTLRRSTRAKKSTKTSGEETIPSPATSTSVRRSTRKSKKKETPASDNENNDDGSVSVASAGARRSTRSARKSKKTDSNHHDLRSSDLETRSHHHYHHD